MIAATEASSRGRDDEIARAKDRGGQRHDLGLVPGFLQVEMPGDAASEQPHHLVHAGNHIPQAVAQFVVSEVGHQRAAAAGAAIVVDDQDVVGRPADIELGVLGAAGQRARVAGAGDWFRVW